VLHPQGHRSPRTQRPPGIRCSLVGRRLRTPGAFQPASLPPQGHSPVFPAHQGKTLPLVGGEVKVEPQRSAFSSLANGAAAESHPAAPLLHTPPPLRTDLLLSLTVSVRLLKVASPSRSPGPLITVTALSTNSKGEASRVFNPLPPGCSSPGSASTERSFRTCFEEPSRQY